MTAAAKTSPSPRPDCVIIGAGGHARVVIDCLRGSSAKLALIAVDCNKSLHGSSLDGVSIVGGDEVLGGLAAGTSFTIGLGATSPASARRALFERAVGAGLTPLTVIHPSAIIAFDVEVGRGCQIFAGAILNPGCTLGDNAIVNTGAIVEHDCRISDHAHIAPGACVGGGVTVGTAAHVGLGASVLQEVTIGGGATVGAGAVVIRDVVAGATVVGNPARVLNKS
jgi:UDP-perosamine 4-acetyltransferase